MSNGGTLPQEIVIDILSQLPVKSLCRFKCVSHTWKTIISDPKFVKTHLNRTKKSNNLKYHVEQNIVISSEHNLYSVDFANMNPTATMLDFPEMEQRQAAYGWLVWSSCDGLLLVSHTDCSNFYLLNPSARECKKLPEPALVLNPVVELTTYLYGVGYDSFAHDYKVVSLTHYDTLEEYTFNPERETVVGVYSQKTNNWRRIQDSHYRPMATLGVPCGVLINGCLHYVCSRIFAGSSDYLIAAFNLSDETFTEVVPLPASFDAYDSYEVRCYSVEVLGGCLCLVNLWKDCRREFWMMKEYGVKESWSKFAIDMHEMPRAQVTCLLAEDEFLVKIKELKRDSEYEDKLVVYNSKEETRRDMVVREFRFGRTYVESLISPHYSGGIGRQ